MTESERIHIIALLERAEFDLARLNACADPECLGDSNIRALPRVRAELRRLRGEGAPLRRVG
ncbi:hypothetical protein ACFSM5_17185 [Lacibacterium aquatile]|uniref:Uncharacterized protein n=1 Tax=Lacibacterium aquatile TaxID=1168082 RepID=A0ABW5DU30_9PROT